MASAFSEFYFDPEPHSRPWIFLQEQCFNRDEMDEFQREFFGDECKFFYEVERDEWEGEPDHGERLWPDLDHNITLMELKGYLHRPSKRAEILATLRNFKKYTCATDGQLETLLIKYDCIKRPKEGIALEYFEIMLREKRIELANRLAAEREAIQVFARVRRANRMSLAREDERAAKRSRGPA